MANSDVSRWWIAAEIGLAVALVALPWAFGGAPGWSHWLLAALASAALVAWAGGAAKNHRRWGFHPVLLLPLTVAAFEVVQLVPLPPGLVAALSAPAGELRAFSLEPLGLTRWRPLSVDAPATLRALSRTISLGLLLFVARELGRVSGVRRRLLRVLVLSAVATAVCGFVHLLAGLDSLFGFVHFGGYAPFLTPFGNTNHVSAWLLLGGTVAVALALDSETRDAAFGWGFCALVCGVAVFLTYSRGGSASFIVTWVLVGLSMLASRAELARRAIPWVLIVCTIIAAGLIAWDQLVVRADSVGSIEKLRVTKLDLWPMLTAGVLHYAWVGMGVGAFELGFTRFHERDLTVTFTHPENLPIQLVADLGVPGALLLAGLAAWVAWSLWRRVRASVLERTVFIALVGLVIHDFVDFALELNAVPAAAAIALGLIASLDEDRMRVPVRMRGLVITAFACAVALLPLAWGFPTHLEDEAKLADALRARRDPKDIRALGLTLIDRHPADWVLYANVANDVSSHGAPREALAWVNRWLFLRPGDARAHVAAARALLRLELPMQALSELKAAWSLADPSTLELGLSLAEKQGDWSRVLLDRPGHLELVWSTLLTRGRPADARAVLLAALDFPPSDAVREEAALLLVRHEADRGDPNDALVALDALPAEVRQRAEIAMSRAQLLVRLKRVDEAIGVLDRLLVREPQNVTAGFALADLLASAKKTVAARDVLQRVRPFAGTAPLRSAVFQREASLWVLEERFPRALEALQTASRIEPARADLHYLSAEVLELMGSIHSALDELQKGRVLDTPAGASARDPQLKRLEAALGTSL